MNVNLVMYTEDGRRKDFPLAGPRTIIGRKESCNLRVPLPGISRQHCEVLTSGGKVTVRDVGSSNGTYVNNKRINESPLRAGDRLSVGSVVFTVQIDGQPAKIEQSPAPAARQTVTAEDLLGEEEIDVEDPISALESLASDNEPEEKK